MKEQDGAKMYKVKTIIEGLFGKLLKIYYLFIYLFLNAYFYFLFQISVI
jgi:hypothetical protein